MFSFDLQLDVVVSTEKLQLQIKFKPRYVQCSPNSIYLNVTRLMNRYSHKFMYMYAYQCNPHTKPHKNSFHADHCLTFSIPSCLLYFKSKNLNEKFTMHQPFSVNHSSTGIIMIIRSNEYDTAMCNIHVFVEVITGIYVHTLGSNQAYHRMCTLFPCYPLPILRSSRVRAKPRYALYGNCSFEVIK